MGWCFTVLGSGMCVVSLFLLVYLNTGRSLSRSGLYSADAAIARAEEYDRAQAGDAPTSAPDDNGLRAVRSSRWIASALLALAGFTMIGSGIYGALPVGEHKIDVGFTLLTIAGLLVFAALPLLAISRASE